ncbi:ethyl tert-butyl ether degradation protein EthD [Niastella koreensis]|uniref:Ethyl tert-butyl ether degradation EthD n=2 Tax=Niastella koreensis TaxID=354356 RepID=G8TGV7_NIAKG|nr:EthD family reductase [Niastella koreensis]AEV99559.1 Ethyl tert-butyl ether degradation EthD [Niastella koreensis GR20-10]OQP50150.1 ethyl tert-butyl ether degradation protein EthD [Niastella koreensis]
MATKLRFVLLILAFTGLTNCVTAQQKHSPAPEAGMFKVTILYPNGDDKTFDMDYYEKKHMPMVAGFIGKNLKFYEIDKGISGRTPNDKAPYVAVGYFYITDVTEYNKAIAQNRDAIISDFKNYTNIQPIIQISEIKHIRVLSGGTDDLR